MFEKLFDKVRVKGNIILRESPFIRDLLPVIYNGEANPNAPGSVLYYNSGGRGIIFNRGDACYRVKGCDPHMKLTKRVASSGKNKIEDVRNAANNHYEPYHSQKDRVMFGPGKPFGVFYSEQAELEKNAFTKLAKLYERANIENPCRFLVYKDTGLEVEGRKTYQSVFSLPRKESDFRVKEFEKLLTEKLDHSSPYEIAKKSKNINRLFGRFIYWAGVNTAFLVSSELLPTDSSFVSQNWVISRYNRGYGLFRVDHSSTKSVKAEEVFKELTREEDGLPYLLNNFSIFPSRIQIASNPRAFGIGKKNTKFSEILMNRDNTIHADETKVLETHKFVFDLGVASGLQAIVKGKPLLPISEEMFEEALA